MVWISDAKRYGFFPGFFHYIVTVVECQLSYLLYSK